MQRNAFSADVSRRAQLMNDFGSGHFIKYRYNKYIESISKFCLPFSRSQRRLRIRCPITRQYLCTIFTRNCHDNGVSTSFFGEISTKSPQVELILY